MASLPIRNRIANFFLVLAVLSLIAWIDWYTRPEVPISFLYLIPMALGGRTFRRLPLVVLAALCTVLTEAFDAFAWSLRAGLPRDILYFSAFCGVGFFVHEVVANRRSAAAHLAQLETEISARRNAEEQLRILIESSPVAIFTADISGAVLLANEAAHRLFAVSADAMPGRSISRYLPALIHIPALRGNESAFRTLMQCRGHREEGEPFLADVWFSTYSTSHGPRLAVMVVDASDELRDREEEGFHQLLRGSRIIVGALAHEIRNVCGAIAVVHANLARNGVLHGNKDFEALGNLVMTLERIAAMELRQTASQPTTLNLESFLEELRIVIGARLREENIQVVWQIASLLPPVWADRQSLMQVFLNLVRNSEHAMRDSTERNLIITAQHAPNRVTVTVQDSGCGVAHPENLFRPFLQQAEFTGLGLYVSRSIMRSLRGDLHFVPAASGATFALEFTTLPDFASETNGPQTATFAH